MELNSKEPSDTDRLNFLERYKLDLTWLDGAYVVSGDNGDTVLSVIDVRGATAREAIDDAMREISEAQSVEQTNFVCADCLGNVVRGPNGQLACVAECKRLR
jgi:hypothetical protein